MFTKIIIENIGPITENIVLDFVINKRDKLNEGSYVEVPDKIYVSKIAGIIAGNASGKTTILDTLNKIGSFIELPNTKRSFSEFNDINFDDEFEKMIYYNIKNNIYSNKLPSLNESVQNPIGYIETELYINNNDEYSGFYNYCLRYDKNYVKNGMLEESLYFRKKYNSKKKKEIFKISGNFESEIGYKIAYKNNILEELKNDNKAKNEFLDKINYYQTYAKRYINESSTMDAENYIFPENIVINMIKNKEPIVLEFIKMADENIKKVIVEDSDTKRPKLYFDYGNYKIRYDYISTATKKLCAIASNYVKSCKHGGIFLIDELDNSLNREIIKFILNLYIKNVSNNTSQLIFTTYTPEVLNILRRDQIFILTKLNCSIKLTKFIDYIDEKTQKKVRKDFSFSKSYKNNIIKNFPDSISFEMVERVLREQNK